MAGGCAHTVRAMTQTITLDKFELREQLLTLIDAVGYEFPDTIAHMGACAWAAAEEVVHAGSSIDAALNEANMFALEAFGHSLEIGADAAPALNLLNITGDLLTGGQPAELAVAS